MRGLDAVQLATRVAVTVTFLRLDRRSDRGSEAATALPPGCELVSLRAPSVTFYRYLYDTVGAAHCWWLRRAMPDAVMAGILNDPAVGITVLYDGGEPVGFYELDARGRPDVNLSYFGLVPHAIGKGLGRALLRAAIDDGLAGSDRGLTVNTCTADHPRALPNYLRAGFRPMRSVREMWDIPNRLGMAIPDHLRA